MKEIIRRGKLQFVQRFSKEFDINLSPTNVTLSQACQQFNIVAPHESSRGDTFDDDNDPNVELESDESNSNCSSNYTKSIHESDGFVTHSEDSRSRCMKERNDAVKENDHHENAHVMDLLEALVVNRVRARGG